jgi:hypothetical protein
MNTTETLIHECAHVRRRDPWVLALQRLALVVFWPHPLLDRSDADLPLRLLGFTLLAIGDPRAVPALIRAIPRTLRPAGSDCGFQLSDPELREFMSQHHLSGPDQRGYISLGRPVREIFTALQKISGATCGEEEVFSTLSLLLPQGSVGLQAWEIPNERWDTIAEEARQDRPLELGRPAGDMLMHYDSAQARYIPNRRATFLFITREGTPGILRLTTQVFEPGSRPAPADASPANTDPILRLRKRYALPMAVKDLGPNQDEEEAGGQEAGVKIVNPGIIAIAPKPKAAGWQPIGVRIEYKFFIRDDEGAPNSATGGR